MDTSHSHVTHEQLLGVWRTLPGGTLIQLNTGGNARIKLVGRGASDDIACPITWELEDNGQAFIIYIAAESPHHSRYEVIRNHGDSLELSSTTFSPLVPQGMGPGEEFWRRTKTPASWRS